MGALGTPYLDTLQLGVSGALTRTNTGFLTVGTSFGIVAATGSVPGTMAAADFTKLTNLVTITGTPPIVLTAGAVSISAASGATAGSMSIAHYNLVNGATSANTASTMCVRASDGSANFAATCTFATVSATLVSSSTVNCTSGSATTSWALGSTTASAGTFRLPTSVICNARNNANSNDLRLFSTDSSDNMNFGTTTAGSIPTAFTFTSLATGFLGWYDGTSTQRWSIGTNNGGDIVMAQAKLATAPTSYPTNRFLLYQNASNKMRARTPNNVSKTLLTTQAVSNAGLCFIDEDIATGNTTTTTASGVTVYTPTLDGTALVEGAGFFVITVIGDDIVTHNRAMFVYDVPFNVATSGTLTIPAGTFTERVGCLWDNIGVLHPPGVQNAGSSSGIFTLTSTLRVYPYGKASTNITWQVHTKVYMYQPA